VRGLGRQAILGLWRSDEPGWPLWLCRGAGGVKREMRIRHTCCRRALLRASAISFPIIPLYKFQHSGCSRTPNIDHTQHRLAPARQEASQRRS
jgi:hypothetical protein